MSDKQSNWTYGVVLHTGGFVPISRTARGAKNYATRQRFDEVYRMHEHSWAVELVANKTAKGWKAAT